MHAIKRQIVMRYMTLSLKTNRLSFVDRLLSWNNLITLNLASTQNVRCPFRDSFIAITNSSYLDYLCQKNFTNKSIHILCYLSILGEGEIISGSQKGKSCHFPFLYKGKEHNECTMEDSPGQPWCASEEQYSTSNFGFCKCPFGNNYKFIQSKYWI